MLTFLLTFIIFYKVSLKLLLTNTYENFKLCEHYKKDSKYKLNLNNKC